MHEAKSQFSKLGRLVWQGEEIVIARAGEPYLLLKPYQGPKGERKPGTLKGKIWMAPDFDKTPREVIDSFYNSKIFPDENE